MQRTYTKDLSQKVGETVTIKGFVQAIRNQGKIAFLIIRDVTGLVQIVVLKSAEAAFSAVQDITTESVIEVVGKAKEEKQAPGGFELEA